MKNLEEIKDIIGLHKSELRRQFGVSEIGIFGSYVRGEQRQRSDVDMLVEFRMVPDFIGFLKLESYLSDLLGTRVDLVTKAALKPNIGKRILEEVLYL